MINNAIDRLRSLRVADAMTTTPFAVRENHTLAEAAQIFSQRNITWAPVVDEHERCLGVFSVADLLKGKEKGGALDLDSTRPVAEFMTMGAYTASPDDSLLVAASLMDDRHVHRLPVLDRDGRLIGVLSTMDLVAAVLHIIEEVDASLLADVRREKNSPSW